MAVRRVSRDGRFADRGQLYQASQALALGTVEVDADLTGHRTFRNGDGATVRCTPVTTTPSLAPQPTAAARTGAAERVPDLLAVLGRMPPSCRCMT